METTYKLIIQKTEETENDPQAPVKKTTEIIQLVLTEFQINSLMSGLYSVSFTAST